MISDNKRKQLLGRGLAVFIIVSQLVAILISAVCQVYFPALVNAAAFLLFLSPVCFYLIALPLSWPSFKKAPVGEDNGPVREKMRISSFIMFFIISLSLMYLTNFLTQGLVRLIDLVFHTETGNIVEEILGNVSPWLTVALAVAVGPVMEEVVFRGILLKRLRFLGDKAAILISALAFGLFHCNITQLFYATALGVVFGYVTLRYGKLKYAVILHMLVNLLGGVLAPMLVSLENTFILGIFGMTVIGVIVLGIILFFANRGFIELYDAPARMDPETGEPLHDAGLGKKTVSFFFSGWGLVFTLACVALMVLSIAY